jgi:type 1 glutamine amidotransferase
VIPISALAGNVPSSNSLANKLSRTGRKMDAAWKQAISEGLKASGKIGHNAKNFANSKGLTNTLAKTSIKTGMAAGGAVQGVKALGTIVPAAVKTVIKNPSLKTVKQASAISKGLVKTAVFAGKANGAAKATQRLDKAGFRIGLSGKIKLK